jgi:hypothetical protein
LAETIGQLVNQTSFQFNGTLVETLSVDIFCSFSSFAHHWTGSDDMLVENQARSPE